VPPGRYPVQKICRAKKRRHCLHKCTDIDYTNCRIQCPCNKIDSKPETTTTSSPVTTTSPAMLPDMDLGEISLKEIIPNF